LVKIHIIHPLELHWADVTQRPVDALVIVEDFDGWFV
jgi:hypothetical protein